VLGAAEMTFLRTLSEHVHRTVMNGMADRHIPCIVLTRNYNFPPAMLEVARKRRLPILRTPMITMNFVNTATLCVDNEFAPSATEQGTTVDVKGVGVMIRGDSGVGKSECALALVERGHSLVADDITVIKVLDERELMASSREITRGYMECRGIGIINIAEMFGIKSVRMEKRIDMVVSLRVWTPDAVEERTGLEEYYYEILGIKVPHVELYVRPGRDIARLVEVAAMVQALKRMGHDPALDFNNRLIAHMADHPAGIKKSLRVTECLFPREESNRDPIA
jgi:HPr kinase/phosphorylase